MCSVLKMSPYSMLRLALCSGAQIANPCCGRTSALTVRR
jgi:hypothetical protein